MSTRIAIPSRGYEDWARVLGDPGLHWQPGRSAMCAALSWERAQGLPPEIAAVLGPGAELLLAIPEHKVVVPGRGGDSQCDVFALVRRGETRIALAVEAKVDEPFGGSVGDWLAGGGQSRRDRLAGLCALLGCRTPPPHLRYHLFHRTAAAVLEAHRFGVDAAAMIVQSFSPTGRWRDEFLAFADHLAPGQGPVRKLRLDDGMPLHLAWVQSPQPEPPRNPA